MMMEPIHKALGQALHDNGVEVVTFVPGFGASETFMSYNEIAGKIGKISYHEEVAYTISHGASIIGKRSALLCKSHGVMKAANSITDSLYTSPAAGLVLFVFEDFTGKHSDNILDIYPILRSINIPVIKADKTKIYDDVHTAYQLSEKTKLPAALLIDAMTINEPCTFEPRLDLKKNFSYKRNIYFHVVHPLLAEYQYKVLTTKVEGGNLEAVSRPELPIVPESLTPKVKEGASKYITFFEVFKNIKRDITTGDTGSSSAFAFPPYNSIDIVTYMGGSIPLALGAYLGGFKNVWALTGDFAFISAGHLGLIEAVQRNIPLKIVIFYNRRSSATGGQLISKNILFRILAGYEKFILEISNPEDMFEIDSVLNEAAVSDEMKIIIVNYPE
ncbi:thiamine pyrophosphate-dependent enzyme [Melioribacter sp. OK-6-Me]|uniref:thiamine pyrophosphate-dependent enzyme n=1 Tax=unclassified Melioribacter TaxID=2627329 RepID=UPI003EDAE95A